MPYFKTAQLDSMGRITLPEDIRSLIVTPNDGKVPVVFIGRSKYFEILTRADWDKTDHNQVITSGLEQL